MENPEIVRIPIESRHHSQHKEFLKEVVKRMVELLRDENYTKKLRDEIDQQIKAGAMKEYVLNGARKNAIKEYLQERERERIQS